jgi:wyosine [tRNA(Phe)-imidazoG37] synthetase (radical SAM superfamily)
MQVDPAVFYQPEALLRETKSRIDRLGAEGKPIDYLSFVTDGEPTLDRNLGDLISMLKQELNYPVAVITNGSLLCRDEVAGALHLADWVSVKLDSVVETVWQRINRPDPRLELSKVLEGIRSFASDFRGQLVSETMLVDRVNTAAEPLSQLADYLKEIRPDRAYLGIPNRPPAGPDIRVPDAEQLKGARRIFENVGLKVSTLWNL